jgi:hypothetical protein
MVMRRAKKNAKICLPLGITTKSDFVFAQPRPLPDSGLLGFSLTNWRDCRAHLATQIMAKAAGACAGAPFTMGSM